ncbi:MAG: polysaccharide deacetylase family protein [Solirubrobacterales bacterium]|nr:polysaccharide deacetylase family protein [Solirubrobacterales bacterium]
MGGTAQRGLLRAGLSQAGQSLIFTVRTAAPVPLTHLARLPKTRSARSRYLCLALRRVGRRGERRLCLGGPGQPQRKVGLALVNAAGKTVGKATLAARLKRPSARKIVLVLAPPRAGLTPRRYRWRVLERRGGCRAKPQEACGESLPRRGFRVFRLRPVRAVGCTGDAARLVRNGSRKRKVVALTFDDAPSSYTPGFLDVLRRKHAHGTFFEVGQEMAGRTSTMRRILSEGHEIGNHTTHHSFYPSYWDLAATNALIRAATHFQPCLFRPPGGTVNSSVVAAAARAGMQTILWDVDPSDWATPGSGAVYSRVVGAVRPGSIVLMHDGGGNRSGTLAALPSIIDTLRARGYRFATVTELLGRRLIYRPYG